MTKWRLRESSVAVKLLGDKVLFNKQWYQVVAFTSGSVAVYPISDLEEYNEPPNEIQWDLVDGRFRAVGGGTLTDDDMYEIVRRYNSHTQESSSL